MSDLTLFSRRSVLVFVQVLKFARRIKTEFVKSPLNSQN